MTSQFGLLIDYLSFKKFGHLQYDLNLSLYVIRLFKRFYYFDWSEKLFCLWPSFFLLKGKGFTDNVVFGRVTRILIHQGILTPPELFCAIDSLLNYSYICWIESCVFYYVMSNVKFCLLCSVEVLYVIFGWLLCPV